MTQGKAQPTYVTLAGDLRSRIEAGEYPPGSMMPSESALTAEFGVARGTVRQALAELEREGLVVSQMGRGRRVQGQPTADTPASTRYEDVANQLRTAIKAGEFPPDVRLPGEPVLAARFGTARITVRKALELLQQEGLIVVVPSKGRFVAAQSPPSDTNSEG
ncbi:GntR family transcriptional regulator [Nonomuraea sp. NN258]|uniref:GntR family transcriptional regulator n=1 Tax=Nonomuraea antri TaxID=2730852 RepID=UPI00156823AF|nr:GntR family transcriptional regulator [Nonomuraea antri]NRQ32981.1 GntR family transcriptional regulator [Nonomuraea antri]